MHLLLPVACALVISDQQERPAVIMPVADACPQRTLLLVAHHEKKNEKTIHPKEQKRVRGGKSVGALEL